MFSPKSCPVTGLFRRTALHYPYFQVANLGDFFAVDGDPRPDEIRLFSRDGFGRIREPNTLSNKLL